MWRFCPIQICGAFNQFKFKAMNDQEIIEAKSKEIRRLQQVCREKDEAIKKAIGFISAVENNQAFVNELKDYLG